MQSAQATQALGVQLYFYVRCPTCGKVLGNLQDDYTKLIKEADAEVSDHIPRNLSYDVIMDEYDNAMAQRFANIMKKLGIKRQCCMMRIKNPQQVPVANPNPIESSIAISRFTDGVTRNPTVIQLTKKSRVPGGSSLSMMSITGYEEVMNMKIPGIAQGIESWEEKMLKELEASKPVEGLITEKVMEPISRMQISGSSIQNQQVLSPVSFAGLVPTIETGKSTPIKKRPKVLNAKTKIETNTFVSLPDMMELENSRILTFDAVPQGFETKGNFGNNYNYEDKMMVDSSDLMDIQNLTLSSNY